MKKTLRNFAIVIAMAMLVVLLTGCGGDKLVATKRTEDEYMGNYDEKLEITFKDDKASEINMTYTFDDEEQATTMYGYFSLVTSMFVSEDSEEANPLEGMEVKQDGKKLTIKMDATAYVETLGEDEDTADLSKDAIKASLEEEGYTVK